MATNLFNYLLRRKSGVLDVCGRQVAFTYKAGGNDNSSSLKLAFTGNFSAWAAFRTENRSDRLGKDYGLNREIQLNDPAFDEAVYIECDDSSFISNLLASPEAKDKLKALLERFTSFELKGNRCLLTKIPCDDFSGISMHEMVAAARYEVKVLSKHASSGRGSNFTIGLSAWPGASEVYKFNVRRKEFELVEIGDACFITVKKGFFGFDWIDGRVCRGRGRFVGSGNVDGVFPDNDWRLSGGFFRETAAPAYLRGEGKI